METLIATAFAALFAACWLAEMRIAARLREDRRNHEQKLLNERNTGWDEGRRYEIARRNDQHPRNHGQFTERTR